MSPSKFATTPEPPFYAVIFSSLRTPGDQGYGDTAQRMERLVSDQPGFLGLESVRGADGFGITVAYFRSESDIAAWKAQPEHRAAQDEGHRIWYQHFEVRVAKVERAYAGPSRRPQG